MIVRNRADFRTVLWVTAAVGLVAAAYARPDWALYLSPLGCYLAVACGVIAHNHNHCATFTTKRMNNGFGHLLTLFYGYPTLMWIPTHNLNHHRHLNRPGDATITWRISNKHNFWLAATYFIVSAFYQSPLIKDYIGSARRSNRRLYGRIVFQYVLWIVSLVGLLILACVLHRSLRLGIRVWGLSLALPAVCSLVTIMFFNYTQHVHTDAWSEHDHSRNFTGRIFNFLFFNNGYHTAHHENQNLHWSAPAVGARADRPLDSSGTQAIEPGLVSGPPVHAGPAAAALWHAADRQRTGGGAAVSRRGVELRSLRAARTAGAASASAGDAYDRRS